MSYRTLDVDYKNKLLKIFDTGSEGHWLMEQDGQPFYYNSTFYEQFDLEKANCSIESWISIIHPLDRQIFKRNIYNMQTNSNSRIVSEYRVMNTRGHYVWIEESGTLVCDNDGKFLVGSHRDISDKKLMQDYMYQTAFFDPVSGQMNRSKLIKDLKSNLDMNSRPIVQVNLRRSRMYSRKHGDLVVDEIIGFLQDFSSKQNADWTRLYRISPDSYIIVFGKVIGTLDLLNLVRSVQPSFNDYCKFSKVFTGDELSVGGSYNSDSIEYDVVLDVLAKTCDFAERQCESRYAIYDDKVNTHIERFSSIQENLKNDIDAGKMSIAIQPIVCASTHKTLSYEVLVRWKHAYLGNVPPDEFIPLAEEQGLIHSLGYDVLRQASEFLNQYDRVYSDKIKVNVNVSALQIFRHDFADNAVSIISQFNLKPERFILEITESVLLDCNVSIFERLNYLKKLGFKLSLDDFGSGNSSVFSLFQLPFGQIKIDKILIKEATVNDSCKNFVRFLSEFGSSNNVEIVAEGIEDYSKSNLITGMGVTHLQGYAFGYPLDINQWKKFHAHEIL
ncbi:EAL domain-containing protein [Vibrio sp. 99-70-13A1]|uniref:sensor domain-containing phosphodiesterase n=1 Tax=Vibrio sp. 99-70-13A1 TaxID=2607601 RepID=UPI0014936936|nr:EAL domain-containing protein [Vibrio sp. 99-70-13A1]NOH99375.1 EAL domain-containing protein [Vibrio sp. 99-70-13A1]